MADAPYDPKVQFPIVMPLSFKKTVRVLASERGMTSSQLVRKLLLDTVTQTYPEYDTIRRDIVSNDPDFIAPVVTPETTQDTDTAQGTSEDIREN